MFGGKSLPAKIVGSPVYLARDLIRPCINRVRRARSGRLLAVDLNSWVGLFAHLEWFLEISLHCDRSGLTPCFMSTSRQYVDPGRGPNWFEYFFENPQLTPEEGERVRNGDVPICRIEGIRHLGLRDNYDSQLTLEIAPALVRKYIGVRAEVVERVDGFVRAHLKDRCVLGVHFRGTDKRAEAPRLPYSHVRSAIDRFVSDNPRIDALFVSSDEQAFVEFIDKELGRALPVIYHDDRERSTTDVAVHRSGSGDGFRKAEEAVLNSLLLSRCDALIKTPSILSGWSKLFNPALPVIMLSAPFEGQLWFPDRELVARTPSQGLLS